MQHRKHPYSLCMLIAAFVLGAATAVADPNRNIIFISIDDMRVDPQAITPTLDALATQSTVYANAYTTATWCVPSRTSVLFGLSPATHQVGLSHTNYYQGTPAYTAIYENPSIKALPEILSDAGYTTATTGKVFHHPEPSRWDVNGPRHDASLLLDLTLPLLDDTFLPSGPLPTGKDHPDWAIADWAEQFIQSANGPFFLAVGLLQPHAPWVAPQWAYDLYPTINVHVPLTGDLNDEPPKAIEYADEPLWWGQKQYDLVQTAGSAETKTRGYLAAITHTDAMIDQILTALDNSVHASNTDIIIWSDHGYHLGEKFHWRKRTYWQQTAQVPLIIKSPAIPNGTVATEVSLLDLAPTVLDLAGISPEPQFEGVSLRVGSSPVKIYTENGEAIVSGSIKTIDYDLSTPGNQDRAQYDLVNDPDELVNLLAPSGC